MNAEDIDNRHSTTKRTYGRFGGWRQRRTVIPTTVRGRWRSYYENIADAIMGRAESAVKLNEARRVMAVLDAGVRSAQSGQVVTLR